MNTRQYQECGGCGRLYTAEEIAKMDNHDCNEDDDFGDDE